MRVGRGDTKTRYEGTATGKNIIAVPYHTSNAGEKKETRIARRRYLCTSATVALAGGGSSSGDRVRATNVLGGRYVGGGAFGEI